MTEDIPRIMGDRGYSLNHGNRGFSGCLTKDC